MKKQMSAEDYRNNEAFSRSQLFKLSKSPAHFKYALENPEVETPALAFGTAFHSYVLEKDKFDNEYIVAPKLDRRTKEGKALAAQIEASGKIPISEDTFAQIQAMAESGSKVNVCHSRPKNHRKCGYRQFYAQLHKVRL